MGFYAESGNTWVIRDYAFPRRRCGEVAPAGQSRDVKVSPLANAPPAVAMLVSNGDRCSPVRGGERSCRMV